MNALHARMARRQRGAASLIVVMVLFFLLSLVAAYTGRNLIFDQRTSLNQYRSMQAFEAAEAGIEWALAMLNAGRIGSDCTEASAAVTDTSFRQRYLSIDTNSGMVTPLTPGGIVLTPSCVSDGVGGWRCSCPADAAPTLVPVAGNAVLPAFRVRFTLTQVIDPTTQTVSRPGVVIIESNGCTRLDDACLNFPASAVEVEGRASVAAVAVLKSALVTPPGAALTVSGDVLGGGALVADNRDPELDGYTIQAGGPVSTIGFTLRSSMADRAPGATVSANDTVLAALNGTPDLVFASVFTATPGIYRQQPALTQVTCGGACRQVLTDTAAMNPDRVIWVTDNLDLDSAGDIGSPSSPVVVVVNGRVNFAATGVRIFGFVHARNGNWSGSGEIHGAAFVEGTLATTAAPTIVANNAVLRTLHWRTGSFVRGLGGWNDFRRQVP